MQITDKLINSTKKFILPLAAATAMTFGTAKEAKEQTIYLPPETKGHVVSVGAAVPNQPYSSQPYYHFPGVYGWVAPPTWIAVPVQQFYWVPLPSPQPVYLRPLTLDESIYLLKSGQMSLEDYNYVLKQQQKAEQREALAGLAYTLAQIAQNREIRKYEKNLNECENTLRKTVNEMGLLSAMTNGKWKDKSYSLEHSDVTARNPYYNDVLRYHGEDIAKKHRWIYLDFSVHQDEIERKAEIAKETEKPYLVFTNTNKDSLVGEVRSKLSETIETYKRQIEPLKETERSGERILQQTLSELGFDYTYGGDVDFVVDTSKGGIGVDYSLSKTESEKRMRLAVEQGKAYVVFNEQDPVKLKEQLTNTLKQFVAEGQKQTKTETEREVSARYKWNNRYFTDPGEKEAEAALYRILDELGLQYEKKHKEEVAPAVVFMYDALVKNLYGNDVSIDVFANDGGGLEEHVTKKKKSIDMHRKYPSYMGFSSNYGAENMKKYIFENYKNNVEREKAFFQTLDELDVSYTVKPYYDIGSLGIPLQNVSYSAEVNLPNGRKLKLNLSTEYDWKAFQKRFPNEDAFKGDYSSFREISDPSKLAEETKKVVEKYMKK